MVKALVAPPRLSNRSHPTTILRLKGRAVVRGRAKGTALVSEQPISFLGGVDPASGIVVERGHQLEGQSVQGKVLVFPQGKGSTAGSYVLYQLMRNGSAPAAIINRRAEPVVAVGAIIAGIPMVHGLERDPLEVIRTGDLVTVDGETVTVEVKDEG